MSDSLDKLLPILSRISPGVIHRTLSNEIIEALHDYGFATDSYSLSEILILVEGYNIFKNKLLFEAILESQGQKKFTFGDNKKTKSFLEDLDLDPSNFLIKHEEYETLIKEKPYSTLHPYQQKIKAELSRFISTDTVSDSIMVQMPTGAGKTRVGMESIYDFIRQKTDYDSDDIIFWLAHTDELCEQAIQSFQIGYEKICTTPVNVVRLWGNVNSIEELPKGVTFVVCTFQSAYSMLKTSKIEVDKILNEIRSRTSLLFIDEAHMSLADTFEKTIDYLVSNKTKKIGLTATPGRDGVNKELVETKKLAAFFNDKKIDIVSSCGINDPIKFMQENGILSSIKFEPLDTGFDIDLKDLSADDLLAGKEIPEAIITKLVSNKDRNKKIIDHIIDLGKFEKKKILIFAASVKHANILSTLLNSYDLSAKCITSESSIVDRRNNIKSYKDGYTQILVNYNVLSTGFDEPKTDCIIITRPTFSVVLYSQMIGRGLRGVANGGTKDCLIVNVIDNIVNQPDVSDAYKYFEGGWNG